MRTRAVHRSNRRSPRRRRRSRRTYSLAHLLAKQPKTLAKQPYYSSMLRHYHANPRLQSLRISSRCYTLLNTARIAPEYLENFYRTYRLPRDPFFPLFFACKRGYLTERERLRETRRRYILASLRTLPEPTLRTIRYLGYLERSLNHAGDSPLWQAHIFPRSKKQADAYAKRSAADWQLAVRTHLQRLRSRYPRLKANVTDLIAAQSVLELLPDARSLPGGASFTAAPAPTIQQIQTSFRRLSMIHHPDRGGNGGYFVLLKDATELLRNVGSVTKNGEVKHHS